MSGKYIIGICLLLVMARAIQLSTISQQMTQLDNMKNTIESLEAKLGYQGATNTSAQDPRVVATLPTDQVLLQQ